MFKEKNSKKELVLSLIIVSLIVFGVMLLTKNLIHYYQPLDDHNFYEFQEYRTRGMSFGKIFERWAIDLDGASGRFRPLYWIIRIATFYLLGINWNAMTYLKMIEFILAAWLLFVFARKVGAPLIGAVCFPILCLVGIQGNIL